MKSVLNVQEAQLPNGLRICLVEDHVVPVVGVSVAYSVGSRYEQPGHTGLAHLFEHVMFEGSAHVKKMEHFQLVTEAGGGLNGGTGIEGTIYHEELPSHELELGLWLEADRMGTLLDAISQEKLDNQREVVKNERRQGLDNAPYGRHEELLSEGIYPPGHPLRHSIIGSMEDLDQATLDDCISFFGTWYAPNNAVLTVVGDTELGAVVELAQRHFGWIPRGPQPPAPPDTSAPTLIGKELRETVPDRVPLARIYAGYRGPTDEREGWALSIGAAVLSNGYGSRLNRELVLARLAQDQAFGLEDFAAAPARIGGMATARPETPLEELEAAYHRVVESLAAKPPTPEEIARARALIERQRLDSIATASGMAFSVGWNAAVHGEPERFNRELDALLSISGEEVAAVAARYLVPENRVVLSFVPAERVAAA